MSEFHIVFNVCGSHVLVYLVTRWSTLKIEMLSYSQDFGLGHLS